jgi:hypothetical protein
MEPWLRSLVPSESRCNGEGHRAIGVLARTPPKPSTPRLDRDRRRTDRRSSPWRVHGARPSRHQVAPRGACGDDLALRGTTRHPGARFLFRNVEVGGSSPLTSTPRSARSCRVVLGCNVCSNRGRYFWSVEVGRKALRSRVFRVATAPWTRHGRAMTLASGLGPQRPSPTRVGPLRWIRSISLGFGDFYVPSARKRGGDYYGLRDGAHARGPERCGFVERCVDVSRARRFEDVVTFDARSSRKDKRQFQIPYFVVPAVPVCGRKVFRRRRDLRGDERSTSNSASAWRASTHGIRGAVSPAPTGPVPGLGDVARTTSADDRVPAPEHRTRS